MRTHVCAQVNENLINDVVTVSGWVQRRRDHGGVIFIDLRDASSTLQVVVDPDAKEACIAPDDHFDSIIALDLRTGAINWVTRALPFDAWTVDCIPFFGDGSNCPDPAGPDFDFGQAPALFTVQPDGKGKPVD